MQIRDSKNKNEMEIILLTQCINSARDYQSCGQVGAIFSI